MADARLAPQLAEIGVILLMFGVGMHISIGDLLATRRFALPGAVGQVTVATVLGMALAWLWGWDLGAGLVLGLAISVASTVVLLRVLEANGTLDSPVGRVAVGWLVVEDLIMVVALVLLPALADPLGGRPPSEGGDHSLLVTLAATLAKVAIFVALMLIAGTRVIPWLLARVARTGSRELFILTTLAVALGFAYGASVLFGASFALGAFLAGVVVNESELSHQAAAEALPLQEAFAVLFFVSIGMLIDPQFLLGQWGHILAVFALIVGGKALIALALIRALGGSWSTGLLVAASLSQIGEFSFILADLGGSLELLPTEGRNLILAGALLSITLNPLLFRLVGLLTIRIEGRADHLAEDARHSRPSL